MSACYIQQERLDSGGFSPIKILEKGD